MIDQAKFNLATADKHQMKYFAKELGLSLSMSMSETTMREKIEKFHVKNDMEMPVSELEVSPAIKNQTTFTINIPKSPLPNGDEPVFVGVQGVGYMIPRGINLKVPESVVEVLRNAIQDTVTQDEDGTIHHNESPAFPFSVLEKHDVAA